MSASRLFLLTTLVACTAVTSHKCYGQPNGHAYGLENIASENDLRWFEPADLDLDGRLDTEAGYFFRFDKLGLYVSGERVEIGDPNEIVFSEQIYQQTTVDLAQLRVNELLTQNPAVDPLAVALTVGVTFEELGGVIVTDPLVVPDPNNAGGTIVIQVPRVATVNDQLPDPYLVRNGIKDATPRAELGWGERYEFGYSDGERGWLIGVLDGPEVNSGGIFGRSVDPLNPTNAEQFGFGQVAVNFRTPAGFREGFRNYFVVGDDDDDEDNDIGVNGGPAFKIQQVGDDNEDFAIDDINGNGATFVRVGADLDGDGTIDEDEVVAILVDAGDLHEFNFVFDQVDARNRVEMDGVELMFTHDLDTGHKLDRGRRDSVQIRYGVNFLRIRDELNVNMLGGLLGRTFVDHLTDNQIVGPQFGVRWRRDHGKWDFTVDGRATLGYNIVDQNQSSLFGENLIPGASNSLLSGRPTVSVDSLHEDDFSPMAELRLEARYKITRALALKMGYNARFIDNIYRASNAVDYSAPEFGFKDGKSDVFINGLTMGIEFRH